MAFARSCIDRHLGSGLLPKSMTDRLQCTALGHPTKLVEPTAAAHAAVTPLTLHARLHTIPVMQPEGCTWAYDQMDRRQQSTVKETSGELPHDWDSAKVATMMTRMQEVGRYEKVNVDFTVASEHKITIAPWPDSNDQLERLCSQYCRHLRLSGEAGLSCHFVHSLPYRPNPIPQSAKALLEYMPDIQQGTARWSLASARVTSGVPLRQTRSARYGLF